MEIRLMRPWNYGKKTGSYNGKRLPVPEHHDEIVRLYVDEKRSPSYIAEKYLPEHTASGGYKAVRAILKHKGVQLRTPSESLKAFFHAHGRVRRGPKTR